MGNCVISKASSGPKLIKYGTGSPIFTGEEFTKRVNNGKLYILFVNNNQSTDRWVPVLVSFDNFDGQTDTHQFLNGYYLGSSDRMSVLANVSFSQSKFSFYAQVHGADAFTCSYALYEL